MSLAELISLMGEIPRVFSSGELETALGLYDSMVVNNINPFIHGGFKEEYSNLVYDSINVLIQEKSSLLTVIMGLFKVTFLGFSMFFTNLFLYYEYIKVVSGAIDLPQFIQIHIALIFIVTKNAFFVYLNNCNFSEINLLYWIFSSIYTVGFIEIADIFIKRFEFLGFMLEVPQLKDFIEMSPGGTETYITIFFLKKFVY